jgi:crotonobetainyl-CoA:carnitine CoA-transferase CaiB-like acyl-CoA transferase
MVPHNIYPALGEDRWIAIACRDQNDWQLLSSEINESWVSAERFADLGRRLDGQDELDKLIGNWTASRDAKILGARLTDLGVPASEVSRPGERIEQDPDTAAWGLWPEVTHSIIGSVRVDGLPLRFSATEWEYSGPAPLLGEHNEKVLCGLLGVPQRELAQLRKDGVI